MTIETISTRVAEPTVPGSAARFLDQHMLDCVSACTDCAAFCLAAVNHCLSLGGRHSEPGHVRLLLDCAEICQTSANYMIRGSDLHARTCSACAEVCSECAASCEQMGEDEQMKACADACRRCEAECKRMSLS
jgi:hypothetical protein